MVGDNRPWCCCGRDCGRNGNHNDNRDNNQTSNDLAVVCGAPAMLLIHALGVLAALVGTARADDETRTSTTQVTRQVTRTPSAATTTSTGPATITVQVGAVS